MPKSHIQLNKALMNKFSFKAVDPSSGKFQSLVDTVYYLDIGEKEIKTEKTSVLGTKLGFYSDAVESKLADIEHNFARVVKKLEEWKQGSNYTVDSYSDEIIAFANLLIDRSELRHNQRYSISQKMFQEKYSGDHELLKKYPISVWTSPLFDENYGVALVINHTNKNFVIARVGYSLNLHPHDREQNFHAILPIGTKRAIMIFPKNKPFFKLPNSTFPAPIVNINDDTSVMALNHNALITEKTVDQAFVISKSREELEVLLEFLKSPTWELYKSK